ncbi:MAG: T9SS type A sorting domain-containing protein [Ferruginibacter sp.]
MKKITQLTPRPISFMLLVVVFLVFNMIPNKAVAQVFCANELVIWTEDFGTGTNSSSEPNVVNLNYQANGPLNSNGTYRSINWTDQHVDWHKSQDHTPGDVNGKMLVINGKTERFYRKGVTRALGYPAGFYAVSFFIMNVQVPGLCAPNPVLPAITIRAEYRDANNDWIQLINSPVTTTPLPQTATPTWVQAGGVFTLPTTGTFVVKRIRFFLSDGTVNGCGNDFAIDDLKLATCPTGGPLPVQFLNVTAHQKGSGVAIDWSTASEFNNKYFDVEKSTDGGISWSVVTTMQSKGNGNTTKNYTSYDAKPVAGPNYYRIKQVDMDGTSKYSNTVVFKLNIVKTDVSVLANPFNSNITIDFLSTHNQVVSGRLFDMTGKQVLSQQLNISKGSTRKIIEGVSSLNRGIYILHIVDENGVIIYNDKLMKQ